MKSNGKSQKENKKPTFFINALIVLIVFQTAHAEPSPEQKKSENQFVETNTIECEISLELAKNNHLASMKQHADFLREGTFCKKNLEDAIYWYAKAYELSDNDSGLQLAQIYLDEPSKKNKGISILQNLANLGIDAAINMLAYTYILDDELNKSAEVLEKHLSSNDAVTNEILSLLYFKQKYEHHDLAKSLKYAIKAAELGSIAFKIIAGTELIGQSLDENKGLEFIKQTADTGDAEAILFLSNYYQNNIAKTSSTEDALYWVIAAASLGDEPSLHFLRSFSHTEKKFDSDKKDIVMIYLCEGNPPIFNGG